MSSPETIQGKTLLVVEDDSRHGEESFALRAYETKAEYFVTKAGNLRLILTAVRELLKATPS